MGLLLTSSKRLMNPVEYLVAIVSIDWVAINDSEPLALNSLDFHKENSSEFLK